MLLKYYINKNPFYVKFSKKIDQILIKTIEKVKSDKKLLIIYDKNISFEILSQIKNSLKISGCKIYYFSMDGSKKNKNIHYLIKIIDFMLVKKFTKASILLSVGGGVIGDMSALAGNLYFRGLNYFHIPTTMTAIVDSSIGGKTAINHKGFINAIGSYYHPKYVFIFHEIIKLIPDREYIAGMPEIIKCGILKDQSILKLVKKNYNKIISRNYKTLMSICLKVLKVKIYYFKDDIHEKYFRLFLNFGHTFAHAIEISTDSQKKDYFRHGEAVGLGMLCEIFYSSNKNEKFKELYSLLKLFKLPTSIPAKKFPSKLKINIFNNLYKDKKRISKHPRYIKIKNGINRISELDDSEKILETIDMIVD
jgi:3-dehydroquinate synthetase